MSQTLISPILPIASASLSRRTLCAAALGSLCALFIRPAAAATATALALLLAREWPADADPAGHLSARSSTACGRCGTAGCCAFAAAG